MRHAFVHTAQMLVSLGLIDAAAIADPEGHHDHCLTAMLVNELHERIARDAEDARLFRLWIEEASVRPSRVANAIFACTTPDEYRAALRTLLSISYTGPQPIGRSVA